ncbi:MAG: hypothetical protein ACK4IS_03020 [Erythrobacter sp.]
MRSAYAIEASPWSPKENIEAALLFRGAVVSAHGYIETRLAELALRSSIMTEYASLQATFPYRHSSRLSYLRRIFSLEPLKPYNNSAERFFARFDAGAEHRHVMAHAKMKVNGSWIVFEDFKTGKIDTGQKGAILQRRFTFTLSDLEKIAWKSVCLSRICQRLANEVEKLEILPSLDSLQA